jgi:hypothetical protein
MKVAVFALCLVAGIASSSAYSIPNQGKDVSFSAEEGVMM